MSDHEALQEAVLLLASEAPQVLEALLVEDILLDHHTTNSPIVVRQNKVHRDIGIEILLENHSVGFRSITGPSPGLPNMHRAIRVNLLQRGVDFQVTMETRPLGAG